MGQAQTNCDGNKNIKKLIFSFMKVFMEPNHFARNLYSDLQVKFIKEFEN